MAIVVVGGIVSGIAAGGGLVVWEGGRRWRVGDGGVLTFA